MSSNYVNAASIGKNNQQQCSVVKLKLRITLIFSTFVPSQVAIGRAFRKGDSVLGDDSGDGLSQELGGSEVSFVDADEQSGEYVIEDMICDVDEASPKAMEQMSKMIDSYVKTMCGKSDVEKVIVCFFVPSISDAPITPTLFFQTFTPSCILTNGQKGVLQKIDSNRSNIYYFGFDNIVSHSLTSNNNMGFTNSALSATIIQLSALICQYTYFYIDYYELNDWSFFKETKSSVARRESISKYFLQSPKESPSSIWKKIGQSISASLSLPYKALCKTLKILCDYDGHLKGRIYKRIKEVTDITGEDYCQVIETILLESRKRGTPISLYEYFQLCGYWDKYLHNDSLKIEAQKWKVKQHLKGIVSGFGALLFVNGNDCICCLKGTDFDSYGRDWILTNALQGLTGFSLQHVRAVREGKRLDSEVGGRGNVWFTGHSLGGGLCSAATIATKGRTGITFNAAGLNVMGVKINQLLNNPQGILHPNQSWNRVFPYRIKGEVLDHAQEKYLRPVTFQTLERGYGKKSVEIKLIKEDEDKELPCMDRHGINNFLIKEVMMKLQPFGELSDKNVVVTNGGNNKVVKVTFTSKNLKMESFQG